MLALAAAMHRNQEKSSEILNLAKQALAKNPNYVSPNYQKEQLWGSSLLKATKQLLTNPQLLSDVERALANSDTSIE